MKDINRDKFGGMGSAYYAFTVPEEHQHLVKEIDVREFQLYVYA